jgi:hypothetical protein
MIGDVDFNVSKLYGMLPASVSGDPAKPVFPHSCNTESRDLKWVARGLNYSLDRRQMTATAEPITIIAPETFSTGSLFVRAK